MRLDFNVLWVDDQPQGIAAQIDAIKRQMLAQGFDFCPKLCQTMEEVKTQLSDELFNDEVDLVLVDWDLGGGVEGQDAIAEIRDHLQYKDVVFYSAMTDSDRLRQYAFDTGLEGIYCARRADLVDEVIGVFESLVKKVLDLDHTRGIVMSATSDIDHLTRTCLSLIYDKAGAADQTSMIEKALERIRNRVASMQKIAERIENDPSLDNILKAHMVFTANDGLRLLSTMLKSLEAAEFGSYRDHVNSYAQNILPKRNVLGHQVLSPDGRAVAIENTNGTRVSVEEMRELRCRLLEMRGIFRDLYAAL